ncbi:uncharacterized protein METZ01_LOCUS184762, partial [marine metagenome]
IPGDDAWNAAAPYASDVNCEHKDLTTLIGDRMEAWKDDAGTKQLMVWAAKTC